MLPSSSDKLEVQEKLHRHSKDSSLHVSGSTGALYFLVASEKTIATALMPLYLVHSSED